LKEAAMLKSFCLTLMLLVALPTVAGDAAIYETVLTKRVDGEITIDTEGNVVAHAFKTEMEPEIRAFVENAVTTWKFHPYLVDGIAVRARSKMRVTVVARQDAGKFKVSIDNVNFSGDEKDAASADKKSPAADPADPRTGITMRVVRRPATIQYPKYVVNGMTVIALRLDRNGKVEDAIATQTTFFNAKGTAEDFDQARKSMEENAVKGIKRWTFAVTMPEGVEPRPEDLTGIITVNYVTGPMALLGSRKGSATSDAAGKWRQETRALNRSIPWISDRRLAQSVRASDFDADSAMFNLESGFRLREGEGVAL
jgi:hypothetical protein